MHRNWAFQVTCYIKSCSFCPLLALVNALLMTSNHLFTPDILVPTQIGAFLVALHIHRVERRPESLSAAAAVLHEHALRPATEDHDKDFAIGTEGDRLASVLPLGSLLIKVCRHAITSVPCADIKISMGVKLHRCLEAQLILLSRSIAFDSPVTWNGSSDKAYSFRLHFCASLPLPAGSSYTILKSTSMCTIFNVLRSLINLLSVTERELGFTIAS